MNDLLMNNITVDYLSNVDTFGTIQSVLISEVIYYIIFGTNELSSDMRGVHIESFHCVVIFLSLKTIVIMSIYNVFVAYSAVETFIRSKYERKIYMRKSTETTIPPNKEVVTKPKKESSLVKGKQPTETVQPRSRQIQSKPRPPQTQPSPVKQQDQVR
jgi:hypothetical protein